MKNRCYPKYSYLLSAVLACITIVFSIVPIFINTNEEIIWKIIWSSAMIFMSGAFIIGSIIDLQWFVIEGEYIIVKTVFGTFNKLLIENLTASLETLDTYHSWVLSIPVKWICIYDDKDTIKFQKRFRSGCSNKRNQKRIQIVFTEKNYELIKKYIKINNFNITDIK